MISKTFLWTAKYTTNFKLHLLTLYWWTNKVSKHFIKILFSNLCQLQTKQLKWLTESSEVCIQQLLIHHH
jgi:hypothetical protein